MAPATMSDATKSVRDPESESINPIWDVPKSGPGGGGGNRTRVSFPIFCRAAPRKAIKLEEPTTVLASNGLGAVVESE
jgi:hypothetical protein